MASRTAFRDVTVGQLLTQLASSIPNNEALVYTDRGLRMTFAELEREARLIARGLIGAGVQRGDRVAVWATNVPEWIVLQFALAKAGAILVTVNTSLRAREIEYLLRQSESTTLFTIAGFRGVDYLAELREANPAGVQRVFFIGENCPPDLAPYAHLRTLAAGVTESALDEREALVNVDDVINMQYTSGTTGFPKGVMLSSRNIVNNGYWIGEGLGYTPADRLCLCVPLFHCFGCVLGVLAAYTHGSCLCAVEFFDPLRVLETVDREKCTALYGVPTMFLVASHRHHGRRVMSRTADASRHRSDENARADDCLWPDRNVAWPHADSARCRPRGAHTNRWPRDARDRSPHRQSRDRGRHAGWRRR
jgi:fatty-acyl-CoA synthase